MQTQCKRICLIFYITIFFLIAPSFVSAATYYVDVASKGGSCNDSNTGTATSSPWCTTLKATTLVAGDTLFFRQGTYPAFSLRNVGTASAPVTFQAYQTEKVIIDGSGSEYGIRVNGGKYITLRGFEVTKSDANGIQILNASNNTVDRNTVYNNHTSGIRVYAGSTTIAINNVISNNIVHDHVLAMGDSDGINQFGKYVAGTVITGNIVYNNSDDGIDVYNTHDNVIEKNIVYNQGNNPSYPGDGNGIKAGSGGTNFGADDLTGGNNIIRQNISFNNRTNGFDSNSSGGNKYFHNVSFRNGNNGFRDAGRNSIAGIGESEGCPNTERCKATFAGNISFMNGSNGSGNNIYFDSTQTLYSDYNIWFALPRDPTGAGIKFGSKLFSSLPSFTSTTGFDSHSLSADPQFISATTDAGSFNFRLKSSSPAINAGPPSQVGGVYVSDSRPDIGAYEFTAAPTSGNINDVNKDGRVTIADIKEVLSAWLKTNQCINTQFICDVTQDGKVNVKDFIAVVRSLQ